MLGSIPNVVNFSNIKILSKYFFSPIIATMAQVIDLKVNQINDVDEIKNELKTIELWRNIHLVMRKCLLSNEMFGELFQFLSQRKPKKFELELLDTELDDEKIREICICLEHFELTHLTISLSNFEFTDNQINELCQTISKMKDLEQLQLEMENLKLNEKKRRILYNTLKNKNSLKYIYIKIRK